IVAIVDIVLAQVNERLVEHDLQLEATPEAKLWLGKHGYDREFGARPLRRLIQKEVEDRLSDAVLAGRFEAGDVVIIDVADDAIILRPADGGRVGEGNLEEALPAI